ncbi:MAG: hypothetical protein RMY34_35075 [Aulosira sp. DedQUE10]|nr:hypothetical protein [Aulosira sp. DedQUE10]
MHLIVIISLFLLYLFFLSIIITSPLNQYKLLSSLFLLLIFVCLSVILVSLFILFINKINHNQITAITITSDRSKAISALKNKTLQVWNLTKQKQIFVLRGHRDWVTSIVLVSDNYLISGSRDKTLKVWNLKTRKELFTLIGHAAPVTSVAVTPNGSHIISASSDGVLKIWNLYQFSMKMH